MLAITPRRHTPVQEQEYVVRSTSAPAPGLVERRLVAFVVEPGGPHASPLDRCSISDRTRRAGSAGQPRSGRRAGVAPDHPKCAGRREHSGCARGARAVGQHPTRGSPRGRCRDARPVARFRRWRLLRERLAHHRRDGWRLDAAGEACRRGLVRPGRSVDRTGDDIHQRGGLHPLRPADDGRTRREPHRRRPGQPPRGSVRSADRQPRWRANHQAHCGYPLRADGPVPVGLRRSHPERGRQLAGPGDVRRSPAAVHRRRCAARRAGPSLCGSDRGSSARGLAEAHVRRDWRQLLGSSTRTSLHRHRDRRAERSEAVGLRRRPVRKRHRRAADVRRLAPGTRFAHSLARCGRIGPGQREGAGRADEVAAAPVGGAGREGALAAGDRRPDEAVPARRPDDRPCGRLGQAEHGRPDPAGHRPADPLDEPGQAVPRSGRHCRLRDLDRRRLSRLPVALRHRRGIHVVRRRLGRPVRGDRGTPERAARDLRSAQRPVRSGHPRSGVGRFDVLRSRLTPDERRRDGQLRLQHRRDGQIPQRGRAALALDRRPGVPERQL